MSNYLVTNKAEALYEKYSRVLSEYEKYIHSCSTPFDGIEDIYNRLLSYRQKIILCDEENTYNNLLIKINQYESVISSLTEISV